MKQYLIFVAGFFVVYFVLMVIFNVYWSITDKVNKHRIDMGYSYYDYEKSYKVGFILLLVFMGILLYLLES